MLWNIEGLKNAMNLTPQDFFQGYDIAILTETFLTENWEHPDFYDTHLKATHGERGRPTGGVSILIRPEQTPIKTTRQLEHTILMETKTCTIIAAYFQPNKMAINIMDKISQMIIQSNQNKPIIIAGDVNCRLDIQTYKSKIIMEKLQEDGFALLNNPMVPRYLSHNRKSTIDRNNTGQYNTGMDSKPRSNKKTHPYGNKHKSRPEWNKKKINLELITNHQCQ